MAEPRPPDLPAVSSDISAHIIGQLGGHGLPSQAFEPRRCVRGVPVIACLSPLWTGWHATKSSRMMRR
jgi:hypothetical protein